MSYHIKVTGNYLTSDARTKKEAINLALHQIHAELNRWKDGKQMAAAMFDIEVVKK